MRAILFTLQDRLFEDTDSIIVFKLLQELTRECSTPMMSEGQTFIALSKLFTCRDEYHFKVRNIISKVYGVVCWH